MDDRLRICLWMVGGGIFGAVLGAAFGALTGALYARNGGAAGTRWARHLVEQFLKSAERQPSPIRRAALIGGADGFIFLGILGVIAGVLLGMAGRSADEWRMPLIVGSVLLVSGAIFFGTLAYILTYHRARFLYGVVGGIIGYLGIENLLGSGYGAGGFVFGLTLAQILCSFFRRQDES